VFARVHVLLTTADQYDRGLELVRDNCCLGCATAPAIAHSSVSLIAAVALEEYEATVFDL
jgi:hypothetical protein